MLTFRTVIRDIYTGWLIKKSRNLAGAAVKGSQVVKFALRKNAAYYITSFEPSAEVLQACCRFRGS